MLVPLHSHPPHREDGNSSIDSKDVSVPITALGVARSADLFNPGASVKPVTGPPHELYRASARLRDRLIHVEACA